MTLAQQLDLAPDTPFSVHNLPYGSFSPPGESAARIGVAIGDWILDLAALEEAGHLLAQRPPGAAPLFNQPTLNLFLAQGKQVWDATREQLLHLLTSAHSPLQDEDQAAPFLHHAADCRLHLPVDIGDYTDFYSSKEHASHVGALFRDPANPLLPNWTHIPIAYHGRSSTIQLGGVPVRRPWGQVLAEPGRPVLAPTRELDFELEVGFIVGPGNPDGKPISVGEAADQIFGLVLVNDWSARDIQRWEYQPLGPFLGKNFATSISPWVVPLAALEAFRCAGPAQDPQPLPYLSGGGNCAFDIRLEAQLTTAAMTAAGLPPVTIGATNFRALYWSMAQQLAHHTINGCVMRAGDLLASGTISGADPGSYGCLLEMTRGGREPLALPNGETRTFLVDGDTLSLTGWSQGEGYRVGFGEVRGTILPPGPAPA